MLVSRATPEAPTASSTRREHLPRPLVPHARRGGLSQATLDSLRAPASPSATSLNRGNIFNREVDAVWDQIIPLVGRDDGELIRRNLLANELVQKES